MNFVSSYRSVMMETHRVAVIVASIVRHYKQM